VDGKKIAKRRPKLVIYQEGGLEGNLLATDIKGKKK